MFYKLNVPKNIVCRNKWYLAVWLQIASNKMPTLLPSPTKAAKNIFKKSKRFSVLGVSILSFHRNIANSIEEDCSLSKYKSPHLREQKHNDSHFR